jgi:hypothetical protein
MPVENRRRYARYPMQGAFGRLWSPMDVKLVNLSRTGVALETTHELQAGDSYVVEVSHRDRQVSMELQIRWCGRHSAFTTPAGDELPLYRAGASFIEVAPSRGGGIWDVLRPDQAPPPS